jgi:hypothetical protein
MQNDRLLWIEIARRPDRFFRNARNPERISHSGTAAAVRIASDFGADQYRRQRSSERRFLDGDRWRIVLVAGCP